MIPPVSPLPPETKAAGPGRPKDPGKRAAILDAAKRLFVSQGFERVSMDQIATEAGVSKLTVYSHFGDKDSLFTEAVRAHCEEGMPTTLFVAEPDTPVRERLIAIGNAFFSMIMTPEAIAGHRILCSPQIATSSMPAAFWEAGPQRVQESFAELLERRVANGELEIGDCQRAQRLRHEGLARQGGDGLQHARIQHVPGTDLLFHHVFAGFGVIEGHA